MRILSSPSSFRKPYPSFPLFLSLDDLVISCQNDGFNCMGEHSSPIPARRAKPKVGEPAGVPALGRLGEPPLPSQRTQDEAQSCSEQDRWTLSETIKPLSFPLLSISRSSTRLLPGPSTIHPFSPSAPIPTTHFSFPGPAGRGSFEKAGFRGAA